MIDVVQPLEVNVLAYLTNTVLSPTLSKDVIQSIVAEIMILDAGEVMKVLYKYVNHSCCYISVGIPSHNG